MAIAAEDLKTTPAFDVDAEDLKRVLGNALLFTSKDRARPVLCAVLVEVSDGQIRAVATDSYKIGVDETAAEVSGYGKFLLDREDASTLVKALKGKQRYKVRVVCETLEGNYHPSIMVTGLGWHYTFGPVEGDYPRWEMLFPAETSGQEAGQAIGLAHDHLAAFCKVDTQARFLRWSFNGPLKPAVCSADTFRGLIMPVRL